MVVIIADYRIKKLYLHGCMQPCSQATMLLVRLWVLICHAMQICHKILSGYLYSIFIIQMIAIGIDSFFLQTTKVSETFEVWNALFQKQRIVSTNKAGLLNMTKSHLSQGLLIWRTELSFSAMQKSHYFQPAESGQLILYSSKTIFFTAVKSFIRMR